MFKKMFKTIANKLFNASKKEPLFAVQNLKEPQRLGLDSDIPQAPPERSRKGYSKDGEIVSYERMVRVWTPTAKNPVRNEGRNKAKLIRREDDKKFSRRQLVEFHIYYVRKKNRGKGLNRFGYPVFG